MDASHSEQEPAAHTLKCPKCGAEHVQRLKVLHESGISTTKSTTLGVATTGRGLGVGVAGTSGEQHTLLSKKFAPPKEPEMPSRSVAIAKAQEMNPDLKPKQEEVAANNRGCLLAAVGVVAGFFIGCFVSAPLGWLVAIAVPIAARFYAESHWDKPLLTLRNKAAAEIYAGLCADVRKGHQANLARWERSYYCQRCGNVFEWAGGVESSHGFEWPKG